MTNSTTQKNIYDKNGNLIEQDTYSNGIIAEKAYYNNNKLTETDFYTTGTLFEKFFYNSNNKMTEIDVYTNGILSGKDYYTYDKNGNLTEADYFNSNGILTGKNLYTNNLLTEADTYTNGSLSGKNLYTNNLLTEIDTCNSKGTITQKVFYKGSSCITEVDGFDSSGIIMQKVFYTNNICNEMDSYRNGIISQRYYYNSSNKMTQVDFFANGIIAESAHYNTNNNTVTERDYFNSDGSSNGKNLYIFDATGKLTEEDYHNSKGTITERDYFNTSGVLTLNNYYDSNGNLLTNNSSGIVTTDTSNIKVIDYGQNNQWANYLDYSQGDNDKKYASDCGLVSCENVLIEEGILTKKTNYSPSKSAAANGEWVYKNYNDTDESAVVDYAAANGYTTGITNSDPYCNGATSACQIWDILNNFGVPANEEVTGLTGIANAIKNNECVIVTVDANILWKNKIPAGYQLTANHAVTVTGVAYNYANPSQIDGFYICDSGAGMVAGIKDANEFVSYSNMAAAFDILNGGIAGTAIITDKIKQTLSSSVTTSSAAGVSTSTVNTLIQQMTSFKTATNGLIGTAITENNQNQNLLNIIANHSAT